MPIYLISRNAILLFAVALEFQAGHAHIIVLDKTLFLSGEFLPVWGILVTALKFAKCSFSYRKKKKVFLKISKFQRIEKAD